MTRKNKNAKYITAAIAAAAAIAGAISEFLVKEILLWKSDRELILMM